MAQRKYYRFQTKKKSAFKKLFFVLKSIFATIIVGLLLTIGVFAYYAKDLPNPQSVLNRPLAESTKIYDRTGKVLLYEVYQGKKRSIVSSAEISPYIKEAIVSIEDKDFYHHHGVDFRGMLRSAWVALKTGGHQLQGASTITQQFIRNSLLTPSRTISRKIKEIILALELERKYSKDQILTFYLNQISFGSNAYGIEAASETFFGKPAKEIDLAEAAILAALPKAPTRLSPYGNHPDLLRQRQEIILNKMYQQGYISKREEQEALQEKIVYQPQAQGIKAPHFVMYIKEILEQKYGKDMVEKGGLKVVTTLDWKLQEKAEEIVKKQAEKNEKAYNAKNAALVAIDPQTGEILSMVGSRDYFDIKNDGNVNVILSKRQPGSAFKPFAYAAAFEKGYTPNTLLFDVKTEFNPYCVYSAVQDKDRFGLKCYHPRDYDGKERGPVTMRQALAQSLNIPSVKTLYLAGVNSTIDLAQKMGITTLQNRKRFGLALVLGGAEVKPLDITSAFGVFATEGLRASPHGILKVEDRNGNILEDDEKKQSVRVLDKNICRMINSVLSDNAARAPMFGASSPLFLGKDIPAAAKTGTTQDYRDGWTIGYTPDLVTGVWTGNNDNTPMYRMAGVATAGPIWHDFMLYALKSRPILQFTPPQIPELDKPVLNGQVGGEIVKIDKVSGKRATNLTPPELIEKKLYKQAHCILYYLDKDNPLGSSPDNPAQDPQFKNWEEAVQSWAYDPQRGGWTKEEPPQEYDDIHTQANKPTITITSPQEGTTITKSYLTIKTEVAARYKIKEVDFFFDDQFIGSKITSPYEWNFTINNEKWLSGLHTIKAKAYDIYLNSAETAVKIDTQIKNPSEQIISPTIQLEQPLQDNPPFIIDLSIRGSLSSIKLYYSFREDLSNSYFISEMKTGSPFSNEENPGWEKINDSQYQFFWDANLSAGKYYLFALGQDKNQNIIRSNKVLITVLSH